MKAVKELKFGRKEALQCVMHSHASAKFSARVLTAAQLRFVVRDSHGVFLAETDDYAYARGVMWMHDGSTIYDRRSWKKN